jgi:hypothetical protein
MPLGEASLKTRARTAGTSGSIPIVLSASFRAPDTAGTGARMNVDSDRADGPDTSVRQNNRSTSDRDTARAVMRVDRQSSRRDRDSAPPPALMSLAG